MSLHDIEAWQISLIVTVAVVLGELAVSALAHHFRPRLPAQWRTSLLALLFIVTVLVFLRTFGPSMADHVTNTAGGIAAVVTLWLTGRAYYTAREGRTKAPDDRPEPTPEQPPDPPPPDPPPSDPPPSDPPRVAEPPRSSEGLFAEWKRSRRKARNRS